MFRLFTIYWPETNADRRAELDFALKVNLSAFDEVTILSENMPRPPWFKGKSKWFDGGKRQTFADLLALAASPPPVYVTAWPQQPHELGVTVIANSDIMFTKDNLELIDEHLKADECYCLSRWDMLGGGGLHLFDERSSQDAWVFRGKPRQIIGSEFWIGVPGCDNRLAHELDAAGYKVLNPSKSIQSSHYHLAREPDGKKEIRRTSNDNDLRLPLPYLRIAPHALGEEPEYSRPTKLPKRAGFHRV